MNNLFQVDENSIYVIYRLGGPYWKNILSRSQKRPETEGRGTFLRPRQNIFKYGPVNNLFIFLVNLILIPQIPVLRF